METIDEHARTAAQASARNGHGPDSFRVASDRLREEFDTTLGAIRRSLYVEKQAFQLTVVDGALSAAMLLTLGAAVLALAVAAAWLLVTSLRSGLALWTANAWWADLVLAVALFAVLGAAAHFVRRSIHKAALSKTRRYLAASAPGMGGDPKPELRAHHRHGEAAA